MTLHSKPKPTVKTTADYLAQAVFEDLLPQHPQTCEDYGFNRAVTMEEKCNLLGLYIGLITFMEISPKTIHDWRVRGVLVDEIKAAFYRIPERSRGAYFPWFLKNQHIVALAGKPISISEICDHSDTMLLHAWRFTGGSEEDSLGEIRAAMERKTVEEQKCYTLYTLVLSKLTPSPSLDAWIDFGFASCVSEREESVLGVQYRQLITMCTFNEFCDAYRTRGLLDLFHSKGMQVKENAQLRDLLSGHSWRKSVWTLKRFVVKEAFVNEGLTPSVLVDYGFFNCKHASERQQLKNVYKNFFVNHHGDPLALHNAAMKGNIYGFVSSIVKGLHDPNYQRLMKNPYPLPDLDMPSRSRYSAWGISPSVLLVFSLVLGIVLLAIFWMRILS